MTCDVVLRMKGVRKHYGADQARVVVLDGVDLEINQGEIVAIMGASGSGKTTLLSVASSLDADYSGDIQLLGVCLARATEKALDVIRRNSLGFLLQRPFLIQEMTAVENIMLAATLAGLSYTEAKERAQTLLDGVRLERHAYAEKPAVLSPGQAQRVALARALVHSPRFVVCDEPTASLDRLTGASVMDSLCVLVQQSKASVLMATHDAHIARRCHKVFVVEKGRLRLINLRQRADL